jgi:Holliday junction resolvase RusA-like endonuclease
MLDATHVVHEAIRRDPECADALIRLAASILNTEPQRAAGSQPLGHPEEKAGSAKRVKVCICRKGTRLLDLDNLAGGTKALLDALRYEGVIQDDDPGSIDFEVRQEKVKRADIGTEITITIL